MQTCYKLASKLQKVSKDQKVHKLKPFHSFLKIPSIDKFSIKMVRAILSYLVHMIVLKAEMCVSFFYLVTNIVCTVSNMQIVHFSPGKK